MKSTKKVAKGTTKKAKGQQKSTNNISTSKKAFATKSNLYSNLILFYFFSKSWINKSK